LAAPDAVHLKLGKQVELDLSQSALDSVIHWFTAYPWELALIVALIAFGIWQWRLSAKERSVDKLEYRAVRDNISSGGQKPAKVKDGTK
jgi:hypothetical protein